MARRTPRALAQAALFAGLACPAAAETRGYVVSWFHMASYNTDGDCAGGPNPPADKLFGRILGDLGTPPDQAAKLIADFPNTMYRIAPTRGRIDGKPVNVYVNPTSVPDPGSRTVLSKVAVGIDLDGKEGPDSFTDPVTGDRGVDNQLFRALGCFTAFRGTWPDRPAYPATHWDQLRDALPAWVIEVTGLDDAVNDDAVEVGLYRATSPILRNGAGQPQADMAFETDGNRRMQSKARGRIKDGVLTTGPFSFDMIGDPFAVPEYHFRDTRLRLQLLPDGGLKGILGGYHPWRDIYVGLALGGAVNEANLSIDVPGIYYALRRLADAYPDETGANTHISSVFTLEAVPAFVVHPRQPGDQTAGLP